MRRMARRAIIAVALTAMALSGCQAQLDTAVEVDDVDAAAARGILQIALPETAIINPFGCGHSYYFVRAVRNWLDAEQYCISKYNAHLVKVNSQYEQNFLVRVIASDAALNTTHYWIGGHTLTPNTNWRWSADYTPFVYSGWLSNQPDGDGSCAHMWLYSSLQLGWNDVNCLSTSVWGSPLYFICEKCGGASC